MAAPSEDELEYLSPGFDPATLTVPRLRAILVSHDIEYPASSKKSQLIEIFNERLVPKARRILNARARVKRTSTGITDVPSSQEASVDGEDDDVPPIRETPGPSTARSRKSRSTRASTDDTLAESASSKTPGRRRTTKTPSNLESDTTPAAELARPSAQRGRRSAAPEVKREEEETPRPVPNDESPFSNDNPFQSGSSPLVQTEVRRKSAGRKSDRKSNSSRKQTEEPVRIKEEPNENGSLVQSMNTYQVPIKSLSRVTKKEENEDALQPGEEFTAEEQQALIQEGVTRGEVDVLDTRRRPAKKTRSTLKTAPVAILAALLASYAAWWRKEKIEVGYCGVGKPATTLVDMQVPEPLMLLQPQCEFCPLHAYCYPDMEARCEQDFVLRNHPLSLGGIIPLRPTCEPDGEKARKVKTVADKAIEELRDRRAKFECGELTQEDGKPVKTVEISEPSLKAEVSSKRRRGMTDQEFEDLWKGAIGEISAREEVASDKDGFLVTSLEALESSASAPPPLQESPSAAPSDDRFEPRWRDIESMLGLFDSARIPGLVAMTLDRVATQAALHAQGSSPEAFVSVGQMRDDVLREEFSPQRRDRLWKKVQAIVENNANVRANVREGRLGEIGRTWEWIGSIEAIEDSWMGDRRRSGRYSLGPPMGTSDGAVQDRSPSPQVGGGAVVDQRKWDEGRPVY